MILIITHDHADFDAIASSYLLTRVFPGSVILKPTMEPEVKEYVAQGQIDLHFADPSQAKYDELIFVDRASDPDLISRYAMESAKISIYDHHPSDDYGSNVAMLFSFFSDHLKSLDPNEAFLALLGIYQDTGGLTYASTRPIDLQASAFFLKCSPPIEKIPYLLNYFRIDEESILIMSRIIANGIRIGTPSCSIMYSYYKVDFYYRGFSLLLNHLINMENLRGIFVLFVFKNKIILTGRSVDEEININELLSRIKKGNGHSLASSRAFPSSMEHVVERQIKSLIANWLFSRPLSFFISFEDYGSSIKSPACGDEVCFDASGTLWEYLDRVSMSGFPDICYNGNILDPVIGAQILPEVIQKPPLPIPSNRKKNTLVVTLRKFLFKVLNNSELGYLKLISSTAEELGVKVFVVGGVVRELISAYIEGSDSLELREMDLSVEGGDAMTFAETFHNKLSGSRLHVYKDFKTATVKPAANTAVSISFDFATCRSESYSAGGALPEIETANLEKDLSRRDFTVNSMAMGLTGRDFGRIFDYFGGQNDLKEKNLRILHFKSFFDDPTRIIRLIRFSCQLGYSIEPVTEAIARFSLAFGITDNIRGLRLTRELKFLFGGKDPMTGIDKLEKYDLIWELFGIEMVSFDKLNRLNTAINWFSLMHPELKLKKYLIIFGYFLRQSRGRNMDATFLFNKKEKAVLGDMIRLKKRKFTTRSRFSTFEKHLTGHSIESRLFFLSLLDKDCRETYIKYLMKEMDYKPPISGKTLSDLGFEGFEIGEVLIQQKLRWLDGNPMTSSEIKNLLGNK